MVVTKIKKENTNLDYMFQIVLETNLIIVIDKQRKLEDLLDMKINIKTLEFTYLINEIEEKDIIDIPNDILKLINTKNRKIFISTKNELEKNKFGFSLNYKNGFEKTK